MRRNVWLAAAALFVGLSVSPAHGSLTFYGTRSSFNAATTSQTIVDFEGIAGDGSYQGEAAPPGITLSGANFTIDRSTSNGNFFVIGKDFYYPGTSVLSSQVSSLADNNILVTLPGAYTAIALDFGTFAGGTTVTFDLSTGDSFSLNTSGALPTLDFVGFTSTAAITGLKISVPTSELVLNIDNFTFGTAVPEPSSLLLGSIGLVGVLGVWRRGRKGR